MATEDMGYGDRTTAHKLHLQFGHCTPEALIQLLKDAKRDSKSLVKEVRDVSKRCVICLQNKKPNPRPIVCLPLARRFNEMVGMDLKKSGVIPTSWSWLILPRDSVLLLS